MLFIELAIGLAVAALFMVVFVVALHIMFWLFFAVLVLAAIGVLIFNFPLSFIAAILLIALAVVGLLQMLLAIGRAVRKSLYNPPPPPPPSTPELPS